VLVLLWAVQKISTRLVQAFSRRLVYKVLHPVMVPALRSRPILSALLILRLILSAVSIPKSMLLTHLNRFLGCIRLLLLLRHGTHSQSNTRPRLTTYPLLCGTPDLLCPGHQHSLLEIPHQACPVQWHLWDLLPSYRKLT
jgi:hypothetical protein